mmetsp:Transcript_562/g.1217  ORF Transcript_562/g.1217 Transcript_562/m.1217 type:complete len:237 (+) Transcript_562:45-755(+)
MSGFDERVIGLAGLTGLTLPSAMELLDEAGGNLELALELAMGIASSGALVVVPSRHPPVEQNREIPRAAEPPTLPLDIPWMDAIRKQAAEVSDALLECEQRGALFTDKLFPANSTSLGGCKGSGEVCSWLRPRDILRGEEPLLFKDTVSPSDVIQGKLQDCWFLGALSIVVSKPGLLQRSLEFAWVHAGVYRVRFFHAGEWVSVLVDDLLPCDRRGNPVFGRCRDPRHVWVLLIFN